MTDRRRGLGRGLGALIPTSAPAAPRPTESEPDAPTAPVPTVVLAPSASPAAPATTVPDEPSDPEPTAGAESPGPSSSAPSTPAGWIDSEPDNLVAGAYFAELPLDAITPNPKQPRHVFEEEQLNELIHSLKEVGLLQPIVVRPLGDEKYELIMGERRWRASQAAGFETIPAIVRETDDEKMLVDALLENLHRAALNPLEEAAAYDQLLQDFECTHEELATRIGRSRPQISNTLRLLKLPPPVQRRVAAGVLSAGHARALLALDDAAAQEHLANRIVAEGLSVRTVEELISLGDAGPKPARKVRAGRRTAPALDDLAATLGDRWDTRVKVQLGQNKGRIVVEFASVEDLERIVGLMSPGTMLGSLRGE
ncbi:ParB/RepB/Spo0J family partition protein [Sporichthya polymorpha]|uniref:ParB/RepB/Spo0J family partition protein n=1 Tax=Sporichthya polymorpha TaxID=35751 RepID=UPI00039A46C0|nr:ParB/RepB/Spo0J family partition protein [Sporichthya polymorpha]